MHDDACALLSSVAQPPADYGYDRLIAPPALIFGDDPDRRRRFAAVVERCGARAVARVAVADALERLDLQASTGLVLLDVVSDRGVVLDRLLSHLDDAAVRFGSVVIVPRSLIDVAAARLEQPGTELLVDPDDQEVADAIARLLAPREAVLADSSREANGQRLQQLSEEVGRIARTLAALSSGSDQSSAGLEPDRRELQIRLTAARTELRLRRLREQHFSHELFADPAWDMLLDLAIAAYERRRVAVSSLCIAAAVPPTTALRWIGTMTEHGLLARSPDPDDGRRVFIALTETATGSMDRYLSAAAVARAG